MIDIGTSLRQFIIECPEIQRLAGIRVHEDHVPQLEDDCDGIEPYVWFGLSEIINDPCLDEPRGAPPDELVYDVEVYSPDQGTTKHMAMCLRDYIHNHVGAMGNVEVQLIEVTAHSDDYLPRGRGDDDGLFEATYSVQITPRY